MGVPNMSKERYTSLSKVQKIAYWLITAAAGSFIAYMWFIY